MACQGFASPSHSHGHDSTPARVQEERRTPDPDDHMSHAHGHHAHSHCPTHGSGHGHYLPPSYTDPHRQRHDDQKEAEEPGERTGLLSTPSAHGEGAPTVTRDSTLSFAVMYLMLTVLFLWFVAMLVLSFLVYTDHKGHGHSFSSAAPCADSCSSTPGPGTGPGPGPLLYFITHGEKTPEDVHNLAPLGFARATYLAGFFGTFFSGAPTHLVAAYPSTLFTEEVTHDTSNRPYQTLLPLSFVLNRTIQTQPDYLHNRPDVLLQCLQQWVKHAQRHERLLVSWEHAAIPGIVSALGILEVHQWGLVPHAEDSASATSTTTTTTAGPCPSVNVAPDFENDVIWIVDPVRKLLTVALEGFRP